MRYVVKSYKDMFIFDSESDLNDYIINLMEIDKFDEYDHNGVKNCPENCVCNSIDVEETIKTVYERGIRITNLRKRNIHVTLENKPYVILEGEDQRMYIVSNQNELVILHSESKANDYMKGSRELILEDDFKKLNKIYIEEADNNTTDIHQDMENIKLNILVSFNEMLKFTNNKETTYVLITDFKYCDKDCPCKEDINIEQLIKTVCKKDKHKKYTYLPLNIYVSLSEFMKIAQKYGHDIHSLEQNRTLCLLL